MSRSRLAFAVVVATAAFAIRAGAQDVCDPGTLDIRSDAGSVRFGVEVVDTVEERAVGLMNRPELAQFAGMLFVYPSPQSVSFWMKNTMIPLDMVFADETGTVQRIHAEAIPYDLTGIPGGPGIQYVLEINGGLAEDLGLAPGAEIRHPAIDPDLAAWSCEGGAG